MADAGAFAAHHDRSRNRVELRLALPPQDLNHFFKPIRHGPPASGPAAETVAFPARSSFGRPIRLHIRVDLFRDGPNPGQLGRTVDWVRLASLLDRAALARF